MAPSQPKKGSGQPAPDKVYIATLSGDMQTNIIKASEWSSLFILRPAPTAAAITTTLAANLWAAVRQERRRELGTEAAHEGIARLREIQTLRRQAEALLRQRMLEVAGEEKEQKEDNSR